MSDSDHLSGAIEALTNRSNALEKEIEAARAEITAAESKSAELKRARHKTSEELAGVQARLAQVRPDQETLRRELSERVKTLESTLSRNDAERFPQDLKLARLIDERKEMAARRQLESERATFLGRVNGLLSRSGDNVVRLLIARRAIEACERRQISASSFTGLTDKTTAEEILSKLKGIAETATEKDRGEALWYENMRALIAQVRLTLESHRASAQSQQEQRTQLLAKQQARQHRIEELKKETEAANSPSASTWSPFALVGSAYRSVATSWHSHWLDRTSARLGETDSAMAHAEQTAKEFVRVNAERLRALVHTPVDIDSNLPAGAGLAALLSAATDHETRWRADHSEIHLLGQ